MSDTIEFVELKKLKLDVNNPRFAELYSGSNKEEDLIQYLLYNEAAEDVAKTIVSVGKFHADKALWVLKTDGGYLVKDGNRRCAAVKALRNPTKYELDLKKKIIKTLPILVYDDPDELDKRILQEHTNNVFREWDRIAKALEVYRMFSKGDTIESMKDIDSTPTQLIKLASFYYEAVKKGEEDLKKLLRRGRGKSGGKTIIFERLFRYSRQCGYYFQNKPSYKIKVTDQACFDSYVEALIHYLQDYPEIRTQDIDSWKETFFLKLSPYGFTPCGKSTSSSTNGNSQSSSASSSSSSQTSQPSNQGSQTNPGTTQASSQTSSSTAQRGSTKTKPVYKRKSLPRNLTKPINECYSLDKDKYCNAKTAMTRIALECALKYVVENTEYEPSKKLKDSNYFRNVFFNPDGSKKPFTDFKKLKNLFTQLIDNTGVRKAFENFDMEKTHQTIHNYNVGATPSDSVALCDNLIPILEFLLQKEDDLISSLKKESL